MMRRILALSGVVLISLLAQAAQAQTRRQDTDLTQVQAPGSAPNVQVAEVKNLGVQGDDATLVIQVRWSASTPSLTQVKGFQMLVEVEYADGTKDRSAPLSATPPQTLLRVLNKGANLPKRFKVTITSEYTTALTSALIFTEEFDLTKGNNFDAQAANSTPRPGGQLLSITGLKKQTQGCNPSYDCFDLFWSVSPHAGVDSVNQFKVEAEFTYRFSQTGGATRTTSDTVDGSTHQAHLVNHDPVSGTGDLTIHAKTTVKAFVTVATAKTTEKEGSF